MSRRLLPAVPALLGILVFVPVLSGDFVYDDERFVKRNPAVTEGAPFSDYVTGNTTFAANPGTGGAWRPLRTLLWRLLAMIFGVHAPVFHAVSILLHGVNAALAFRLLAAMRFSHPVPLVASVLFAVHPMTAEAAAWISSFGDVLSMALHLGALLLVARSTGRWVPLGGAAGLGFLAMLGKESAVVLAGTALVAALRSGNWPRARIRRILLLLVPAAVYLVLRALALAETSFGQRDWWGGSFAASQLYMARGVLAYVATALFPFPTRFDWWLEARHPDPFGFVNFLALAAILGASAMALLSLARASRRPDRALGPAAAVILWGGITLTPVAQLLPLNILVADRFYYPTLPVLLGGIVAAGVRAARRFPLVLRRTSAVGAVVLLAAGTLVQSERWRDNEALWRSVLAHSPGQHRALANLGRALHRGGRSAEALPHLEAALATFPHTTTVLVLGEAYEAVGRGRDARRMYRMYLEMAMAGRPEDNPANRRPVYERLRRLDAILGEGETR